MPKGFRRWSPGGLARRDRGRGSGRANGVLRGSRQGAVSIVMCIAPIVRQSRLQDWRASGRLASRRRRWCHRDEGFTCRTHMANLWFHSFAIDPPCLRRGGVSASAHRSADTGDAGRLLLECLEIPGFVPEANMVEKGSLRTQGNLNPARVRQSLRGKAAAALPSRFLRPD